MSRKKQRGPWSAVITRDDRYSNSMHLGRDVHDEKSENGDNPFLFADLSVRVVYSRRQYERGTMNNTKENKPRFSCSLFFQSGLDD